MLLDFKVKNYKSFQQEVSFSMIPAPKQKGLDYSVFEKKIDNKRIEKLFGNLDYGTGMDCDLEMEYKYFKY